MVLRCVVIVFLSDVLLTTRLTIGRSFFPLLSLHQCMKARYAKKVKDKMKAEKVATKERMRRAREHVRVGPLHPGDGAGLSVEKKKDTFLA